MSEENSHVSVKPSESVSKEAEKRVESKSGRKGEPEFHLTEKCAGCLHLGVLL